MMVSRRFSVEVLIQLVFLVAVTVQDDMCGMPAPDPMKTCISVRLPWHPQPMYFCTDKSKFRYRNQCQNRFTANCGMTTIRQDVLMVASPWDCCPLVSYPDSCADQQCAPPPHNRKCQVMEPNPNTWECCSNYFCEENMTPETCHFKRLEPTCNSPPQGKMNCVAFVDPFGCCPKFQCDGEPKPGHCPAEMEAMNFMARFNSSNMMMMGPGYPMMMPGRPGMIMGPGSGSPAGQAEMHVEVAQGGGGAAAAAVAAAPPPAETPPEPAAQVQDAPAGRWYGPPVRASSFSVTPASAAPMIACVGDFNCPGNMKCCSNDYNVYLQDGHYFFRNRNPVYGYCMEPAVASGMSTKTVSIKYTSQ